MEYLLFRRNAGWVKRKQIHGNGKCASKLNGATVCLCCYECQAHPVGSQSLIVTVIHWLETLSMIKILHVVFSMDNGAILFWLRFSDCHFICCYFFWSSCETQLIGPLVPLPPFTGIFACKWMGYYEAEQIIILNWFWRGYHPDSSFVMWMFYKTQYALGHFLFRWNLIRIICANHRKAGLGMEIL